MDVSLVGGSVSAANGGAILQDLAPSAWAASSSGMLVLGAQASDPGSTVDMALGRLRCARWMCCARNKMWWMTPEWGTSATEMPPETQVGACLCRPAGVLPGDG